MLINWRRRLFIGVSLCLCYLDILTDIMFCYEVGLDFTVIGLIILQPAIYCTYFWLGLLIPKCFDDSSHSFSYIIISLLLRGPLFAILCEFKLMLTPLYYLIYSGEVHGDRIKHNFLSHMLTHSIVQSLPMGIYQSLHSKFQEKSGSIMLISPCISFAMVMYGIVALNLIRQMNTGGLSWIQKPKPTLQFYSTLPIPFTDFAD